MGAQTAPTELQRPPLRAPSSIPAKFETLLFTGPREKKGFGSEGRRFQDSEGDTPGPGTYQPCPTSQKGGAATQGPTFEFHHDSISKRGFGPMASKARSRESLQPAISSAAAGTAASTGAGIDACTIAATGDARFERKTKYTGPGPGQYKPRAPDLMGADKYFNQAGATASFHPHQYPPNATAAREEAGLPGPGAYNPSETRTGQKVDLLAAPQTHRSAFKAGGHKLAILGNLESPPPTKYQLGDPWEGGLGKNAASGSKAGTSSFAGRSMTSLNAIPTIMFLQDAAPGTGKAGTDSSPGPGSYDPGPAPLAKPSALKPTAAFTAHDFIDRFGKSIQPLPEAPGPVDYSMGGSTRSAEQHAGRQQLRSPGPGVGAPFKSLSRGHADYDMKELARAPGPAYYSPKTTLMDHQSHHIRSKKA
ncbi:hypothetical protein QJQ45_003831 [Haematococcus lacustris]|nr:hypothetical protein QJQ45_003831 [Haematococcus lacustris]